MVVDLNLTMEEQIGVINSDFIIFAVEKGTNESFKFISEFYSVFYSSNELTNSFPLVLYAERY